jgi:hypothetical protein
VLGYLELILDSGGIDTTVHKYAERAVSHIRTSTILVDNVKRLMITRKKEASDLRPINLALAMNSAAREIERMFPDRRISVRFPPSDEKINVIGDEAANDLVLNMLVSMVRLDQSYAINLVLQASEVEVDGKDSWKISLEDKTAEIPQMAKDRPIEDAFREDSSIAVKMVGLLYCKMNAEALGGSFEALVPGSKGALFVATLLKAGEA